MHFSKNFSRINLPASKVKIYMPIVGMFLGLRGICSNGENNTLTLVSLLETNDCSIESRNFITQTEEIDVVLNHNNIYSAYNTTIPQFDLRLTNQDKISFGLKYAMYRDTISCLIKSLDFTTFWDIGNYDVDKLNNKQKVSLTVYIFVSMGNVFDTQNAIQLYLLIINISVVGINVLVIIFRVVKSFIKNAYFGHSCLYYEVYFSFIIDIASAIVGGISYFYLENIVNYVNNILDTNCMGNYESYKLDSYANDLYDTADQNLQIFVLMVIKILLITINILYYASVKKCRMTCSKFGHLIYENIHEGDEDDTPLNDREIEEKKDEEEKETIKKKESKINEGGMDKESEDKENDENEYEDNKDNIDIVGNVGNASNANKAEKKDIIKESERSGLKDNKNVEFHNDNDNLDNDRLNNNSSDQIKNKDNDNEIEKQDSKAMFKDNDDHILHGKMNSLHDKKPSNSGKINVRLPIKDEESN